MTTLSQAREAVYQRIVSNYTATPFTFDNEDFTPPDTAWVRFTVRNIGGGQETLGSIGSRKYRRRATLFAQIYTPVDTGLTQGDTLSQTILALFEGESFSLLDFNNGLIRETGPDGRWFQHLAEIFFEYTETK